ncbi:MAG: sensor histidine kinase [Rhodobacteraceae bacterium]|nr:sensor histidine kinase [Paracoccaceae bacterium]MBR9822906.1 sensor histidine kinase [Paracoccaceae bacterium]
MMNHPNPASESILVAEIRHRMSNGFQILQAYTRRQITRCDSEEAAEKLQGVLRQIETVAAQQSALSEADAGNFAGFVETIHPLWQRIGEEAGITVQVNLDAGITLPPTASETAARILMEAVTNCVEHAFPDGRGGQIDITISATDAYHCHCRIADDGVGMSGHGTGDGTGIIRALAETIGGQATWAAGASGGTVLSLDFPVNLPEHVEAMNKATV